MPLVVIEQSELMQMVDQCIAKRLAPFCELLKESTGERETLTTQDACKLAGVSDDTLKRRLKPARQGKGKAQSTWYKDEVLTLR